MAKYKDYIHARLSPDDIQLVNELKYITGDSESMLVKRGIKSLYKDLGKDRKSSTALNLAGSSVGKFAKSKFTDLSTNKKYFAHYGK